MMVFLISERRTISNKETFGIIKDNNYHQIVTRCLYNSAKRSLYGRYLMNTLLGMVYL